MSSALDRQRCAALATVIFLFYFIGIVYGVSQLLSLSEKTTYPVEWFLLCSMYLSFFLSFLRFGMRSGLHSAYDYLTSTRARSACVLLSRTRCSRPDQAKEKIASIVQAAWIILSTIYYYYCPLSTVLQGPGRHAFRHDLAGYARRRPVASGLRLQAQPGSTFGQTPEETLWFGRVRESW
ncbi:hypothetical protein C8Q69DRAFT_447713 [Paecilomyces variotii]|uniref:Uncharacterized protein n=1 Tax=Byssochlamys spectabilis TaxID=264951 RepID=A0A443HL45_BYSSP|nr:hypothetical protein C8Q69DRAFT_447713 [Paecilomyces variotii]RWQ92524.1 hypothetical protein C8Q69DRAFT_447713 [Paecilomyces variotii]